MKKDKRRLAMTVNEFENVDSASIASAYDIPDTTQTNFRPRGLSGSSKLFEVEEAIEDDQDDDIPQSKEW